VAAAPVAGFHHSTSILIKRVFAWPGDCRYDPPTKRGIRGRPTTLTSIDATDDTNLAAIGAPIMRCAQQRAAECRASVGDAGASDAGSSPAAVSSELPPAFAMSWTGLFLECAGLPPDFEAFD
jgi:hypothetical protein